MGEDRRWSNWTAGPKLAFDGIMRYEMRFFLVGSGLNRRKWAERLGRLSLAWRLLVDWVGLELDWTAVSQSDERPIGSCSWR
jgi:hypothetical protein